MAPRTIRPPRVPGPPGALVTMRQATHAGTRSRTRTGHAGGREGPPRVVRGPGPARSSGGGELLRTSRLAVTAVFPLAFSTQHE